MRSDLGDRYAQDCSDRHDDVGRVAGVMELHAGPLGKDADAELSINPLHSAVHSVSLPTQSHERSMTIVNEVPHARKGEGHVFET